MLRASSESAPRQLTPGASRLLAGHKVSLITPSSPLATLSPPSSHIQFHTNKPCAHS